MIERFTSFTEEHKLFKSNHRILLGVSGGADSMAMLRLFHLAGFTIGIVHCNFKLRGDDADADESLVRKEADELGVPYHCRAFDTLDYAEEMNVSVQMAARTLRYDYFEEVAEENNYDRIATAHHLDDQTETFFINLLRGCGIAGLHGIPLKKGRVVRPMLFATRHEIETYVNENKIPFRTDRTNAEVKYLRNRIRHQIIPALEEINPELNKLMADNISHFSDAEHIFRKEIKRLRTELLEEMEEGVSLNIPLLKTLQPRRTILYEMISEYGFRETDADNILDALDGIPGKMFYSPTHQLLVDRDRIIIRVPSADLHDVEEHKIAAADKVIHLPLALKIEILEGEDYEIPHKKDVASLDLDHLSFPLTLRRWRHGDQFIPLGMKHHKKLSDLFIDHKLTRFEKENTWVLCSGKDIAWVVGERIDDRYKVLPETKKVYRISLVH